MDYMASLREVMVLELVDDDYESHHHPWHYWHTTKDTVYPFNNHTPEALPSWLFVTRSV